MPDSRKQTAADPTPALAERATDPAVADQPAPVVPDRDSHDDLVARVARLEQILL